MFPPSVSKYDPEVASSLNLYNTDIYKRNHNPEGDNLRFGKEVNDEKRGTREAAKRCAASQNNLQNKTSSFT